MIWEMMRRMQLKKQAYFLLNSRNEKRALGYAQQSMQEGASADRSMIWAMRDHSHITIGLFLAHRSDQLLEFFFSWW